MKYWKILAALSIAMNALALDPPANTAYRAVDDKLLVFGTDNDYQFKYDSSDNRLELQDAAGNLLVRVTDGGATGVIGATQHDVINGSFASQITSAATANRAVVLPDAAGTVSLLGSTIESAEITDGTIVNADINSAAAIVPTKFSAGTNGQVVVTAGGASGWGTVPSAGITDDTIVNADINSAAAIAITKLSTSGASSGQLIGYNGSIITWITPSAATIGGAGPTTDNAIPRMDGTGGLTLQGYSSNTPTISDAGLLDLPGGATLDGTVTLETGAIEIDSGATFRFMRTDESRIEIETSTGVESGSLGETDLEINIHDNDGAYSHTAVLVNRNPSDGVVIEGTLGTPRPLYVDGDLYIGTGDYQITSGSRVRLEAIAQGGAALNEVLYWNGTYWEPGSVAGTGDVTGPAGSTDSNLAAFDGTGGDLLKDSGIELANVAEIDVAETISANWVNTANPWADNEVANDITVSSSSAVTTTSTSGYAANSTSGPGVYTGKNPTTTANGNAFMRLTGISADSDNTSGTNAARIDLAANGNQTQAYPNGLIVFQVASGTADLATVAQMTSTGINSAAIGATTPATGAFTTLSSTGATTVGDAAADTVHFNANTITFEGATADAFETAFSFTDPTADRTMTFPNRDGITTTTTNTHWIRAADLQPMALGFYGASLANAQVTGSNVWGLGCEDGVLDGMIGWVPIEDDYNSGNVTVTVYWVTTSSSTNNTAWGVLFGCADSGTDVSSATMSTTDPDVTHITSANQGALVVNEATFTSATPANAGTNQPMVLFIGRDSSDVDDNLAATAYVIGAKVSYTRR